MRTSILFGSWLIASAINKNVIDLDSMSIVGIFFSLAITACIIMDCLDFVFDEKFQKRK
jgi:hypothetical protein